ncbi:DNA polymerase III subunit delta [Salininema proteolyticum]|uniref:DNA-directed DNA polymerase n=1 Tax=Salininema proteolyticum TaxID=1607685 RepID=A0ABV8TUR8_9ACTN
MAETLDPIQLVIGDEDFLAERAVSRFLAAVRADDPTAEVSRLNGGDLTAGAFSMLTSPTLLGGGVVAVVDSAQDVDKGLFPSILSYIDDPAPGVYLILVHPGVQKGKALVDGLKKRKVPQVKVSKIKKAADRVAFVRGELTAAGAPTRSSTAAVADLIITAVGSDLRELASACSQLVADTGGKITEEDVRAYYSGRAEVTGFTVADAVVAGRTAEALSTLRSAFQIGVDPVPIADAVAAAVRNLSRVAGERGGSNQLASKLGMAPWQVDKAKRQAQSWTPRGLAEAMTIAARLNGEVKGGMDDREWALEHAVVQISVLAGSSRA